VDWGDFVREKKKNRTEKRREKREKEREKEGNFERRNLQAMAGMKDSPLQEHRSPRFMNGKAADLRFFFFFSFYPFFGKK